jgi:transposase
MKDLPQIKTLAVCAGIDVHKSVLVACIRKELLGLVTYETITTTTSTSDVTRLAETFISKNCKDACMEETSKYGVSVYNILTNLGVHCISTNPFYLKQVATKKNDKLDARRIADYLAKGDVPESFKPQGFERDVRQLVRARILCVYDKTRISNRLNGILVEAGIRIDKIGSFKSEKMLNMIEKIIEDEKFDPQTDVRKLYPLTKQAKIDEYVDGIMGYNLYPGLRIRALKSLQDYKDISKKIVELEKEISNFMPKFEAEIKLLTSLPLLSPLMSMTIISEIGTDMSKFKSDKSLAAFCGLVPGCNSSAGKSKSSRITHAGTYLKPMLVQLAWMLCCGVHKVEYFAKRYEYKSKQIGKKKTIVLIAHKILICVYHMLKDKVPFSPKDKGREFAEEKDVIVETTYYEEDKTPEFINTTTGEVMPQEEINKILSMYNITLK